MGIVTLLTVFLRDIPIYFVARELKQRLAAIALQLFKEIFKNGLLPFKDFSTVNMFEGNKRVELFSFRDVGRYI